MQLHLLKLLIGTQNEEINLEIQENDLIDFSDKDPFSEGDF